MRVSVSEKSPKPAVSYRATPPLVVPTCYDFKQFAGQAGEYRYDPLQQFPQATD